MFSIDYLHRNGVLHRDLKVRVWSITDQIQSYIKCSFWKVILSAAEFVMNLSIGRESYYQRTFWHQTHRLRERLLLLDWREVQHVLWHRRICRSWSAERHQVILTISLYRYIINSLSCRKGYITLLLILCRYDGELAEIWSLGCTIFTLCLG